MFSATYTVDANGLRTTRPALAGPSNATYLFAGCSFTFGTGLNDDETLPSLFARQGPAGDTVLNLGMSGYGPHNILRAFETRRYDRELTPPVRWVIYSAIADHPARAAGNSVWENGPKYEVNQDGRAEYRGPIRSYFAAKALSFLQRSHIFNLLYQSYLKVYGSLFDRNGDLAITRFGAIVERMKDLVRERYGAELVLVLWDRDDAGQRIAIELGKRTIRFFRVSEILPDYESNRDRYEIPIDRHPSAAANRLIAAFLRQHLP